eukprot:s2363_g6.t1
MSDSQAPFSTKNPELPARCASSLKRCRETMHKRKVVQYLSKYIRGLNAEQVSSRLLSGEVELRDAELEVAPLQSLLASAGLPYTLEVLAVSCDLVSVTVPWSALRSRPLQVKIGHVRAQVKVHDATDAAWVEMIAAAAARANTKRSSPASSKEQRSLRVSDVRVAMIDGLHVSVASLQLVCSLASSNPLFAFELQLKEISLNPLATDSKDPDKKAKFRQKSRSWTSLHRRLELQHLGFSAASLTGSASSALLSVSGCCVDLIEGRDVGRRDGQTGSARMALLPRDVRANVSLREFHVQCGQAELADLASLVCHIAQPPVPPLGLLRATTRQHVDAILAQEVKSQRLQREKRAGREPKASGGGGMAHAAQRAQRAAHGAVADATAAADAAAETARRTAAVAVHGAERAAAVAQRATHSATQALGGARRSGHAAAEKALGQAASTSKKALGSLGTLVRGNFKGKLGFAAGPKSVKGITSASGPEQASSTCSLTLEEQEELELQQALALSLQTEACTSSATSEEGIATSTIQLEPSGIDVETTSDHLSAGASETDDDDEQERMVAVDSACPEDVEDADDLEDFDEAADGAQDHEDEDGGGVGGGAGSAALGHLALTRKWRPPNLRVLSTHVSLRKISVRLPICSKACAETQALLEILDLNITLEGFLRLPLAERRCLERLRGASTMQTVAIADNAAIAGFSGSCLLTLCSLQLVVIDSARHPLIQARPIHLRLCCTKRAPSSCPELNSGVCVQGVEIFPQPLVFVALAELQTLVASVIQTRDAVEHLPDATSSPTVAESMNLQPRFHVEIVIRDVRIRLTPSPSLSLSLLLPSLRAVAGDATEQGLLPLPLPHSSGIGVGAAGTAIQNSDSDWHVYGCLGTSSNEAESKSLANWETLVTERQWSEGLQEATTSKRLLLRRNEFLRLSASKLKAFEQTQLQDKIAEEQHAISLTTIAKAKDDRFYDLLAHSEGFEAELQELQAQLEGLRNELRALDELRRKDEGELRDSEREASTRLMITALQHLQNHEHELQQQLEEEKRASEALQQLVATQDLIIQALTAGH